MYRRIIVKVGTKVLSTEDGCLDTATLEHIVSQLNAVKKQGIEVVLVTSGAMGAGRSLMALKRPRERRKSKCSRPSGKYA